MPGFVVHVSAKVFCLHAGQAKPTAINPRVKVDGQFTVTMSTPYAVAGCGLTGSPNPPCATAQWTVASTSVMSGGLPLVLLDSTSVCVPTTTPLKVAASQFRVKAK
jgi:hypothetical protein